MTAQSRLVNGGDGYASLAGEAAAVLELRLDFAGRTFARHFDAHLPEWRLDRLLVTGKDATLLGAKAQADGGGVAKDGVDDSALPAGCRQNGQQRGGAALLALNGRDEG